MSYSSSRPRRLRPSCLSFPPPRPPLALSFCFQRLFFRRRKSIPLCLEVLAQSGPFAFAHRRQLALSIFPGLPASLPSICRAWLRVVTPPDRLLFAREKRFFFSRSYRSDIYPPHLFNFGIGFPVRHQTNTYDIRGEPDNSQHGFVLLARTELKHGLLGFGGGQAALPNRSLSPRTPAAAPPGVSA